MTLSSDLEAATAAARASHRLLFVLFACPRPSARTAAVQRLLEQTTALVPVCLRSLRGIDLNRFVFDYDLALAGLVQTPDGVTLSRWGHAGATPASLTALLRRVANLPWPRTAPQPGESLVQRFPRFAQSPRAALPCYHCHYAHDAQIDALRAVGRFAKHQLFRYPPPSCLGLALADDGVTITHGTATLPAGDMLVALNGTPLYSEADLRFGLDRLPVTAPVVTLTVQRQGRLRPVRVPLKPGWREYDISVRPSQGAVPPILGFWEEPVAGSKTLALKVTSLFAGEKWRASQGALRLGDVIVGVDGKRLPVMTPQQFHTWFRLNKEVGQSAALMVLRDGKLLTITVPCLDLSL